MYKEKGRVRQKWGKVVVGLGLKTRREGGGERERSARGQKGGVRDVVCMMSAACWIEVVRPAEFNPG